MKQLFVSLMFVLSALSSSAEIIRISGRGETPYTNPIGKPDKQTVEAARLDAIYKAVDKALELQSAALREQYKKFGKTLTAEEYEAKGIVTESRKATSTADPKARKVTVFFEGTLDLQALRDKMNATASVEGPTDVKLSKVAAVVFFTVRETTENFVFGDKQVTATKRLDSVESDANLAVADGGDSIAAKGSASRIRETKASVETGVAQRSDRQKFALDGPSRDAFGGGLKDIFTSKGFKKIKDGSMLDVSKDLDEAFGAGNVVPAAVKRKIVGEVRENLPNVRYVVVGTVDFAIPTKDPDSGLPMYNGRISGEVWELEDGESLPDVVAALAPSDSSDKGKTQQEAKSRVLVKLSANAANDIITKLRNKAGL
jgi:hypothetical protein